jgi:hypothetical protein
LGRRVIVYTVLTPAVMIDEQHTSRTVLIFTNEYDLRNGQEMTVQQG